MQALKMQELKSQLTAITTTLKSLTHMDVKSFTDIKNLKSVSLVADQVIKALDDETCLLQQLKLRVATQLAQYTTATRQELDTAEKRFMIRYNPVVEEKKYIPIDFAGLTFKCQLVADRRDISPLSYGAVILQGVPTIMYRFGPAEFVSVTPCEIDPGDNIHTICCSNGPACEYGETCRYFHDPAEWLTSRHVQKFQRTALVKKCPTFGHAADAVANAHTLDFDALRTLARYCAVQSLMIYLVANHRAKTNLD